tara:strand:- start:11741 stop:12898 length:1158 start_codon:yes stop_codon:yes gene_type:complete
MDKKLRIKIDGNNIKSLLYGLSIAKLKNFDIYFSFSKKSLCSNEKIYTISKNTKLNLEKLSLWEKIKPKLHIIESYSFFSSHFKKEIVLNFKELFSSIYSNGNIFWAVKHSDLIKILLDEIVKRNNIHFIDSNDINSLSNQKNFYYDFHLKEINLKFKSARKNQIYKKFFSSSSIIFKVLLRGNVEKRAYENIFLGESLLLIPLENNIYQIIWEASTNKSRYLFNLNENLFLDNLSTMLPKDFKLDQIVGDINIFNSSSYSKNSLKFFNKCLYLNDFEYYSQHLFLRELDTFFIDLNIFVKILSSNKNSRLNIFKNLKYRFFIKRIIKIFSKSFKNNISLTSFMRVKFIRKIFISTYLLFSNKNLFINKKFSGIFLKSIFLSLLK